MKRINSDLFSSARRPLTVLAVVRLCLISSVALASTQPYITSHGINFGSGNKYQVETDVNIAGTVSPLLFKRTYNSQSVDTSTMGHGWTISFGEKLKIEADRIVLVQTGGRHVTFMDNNDGTWTNKTGRIRTITQTTGGYSLAEPNGTVKTYDTTGKILSRQDRNNITVTYTYSDTLLSTVTDTFGNALTFTYTNNKVTRLKTPIGSYIYAYDSNDNLVSVTKPDSTIKQYIYDDPNDANNLTGIIGEAGTRILTVTYNTDDRVTGSSKADGSDAYIIEYLPDSQRKITDSLGVPTTYQLEAMYGIIQVKSFTGPGCSACGADTGSAYTYNSRQQLEQKTDAKGSITSYQYDASGNRIGKTEAVGTTEERTTSWTYDPLTNKIATLTKNSVSSPGQQSTSSMGYDASGNLLNNIESGYSGNSPINRTSSYTYDAYGRITSIDGPRTDVADTTTFTYYANDPAEGLNRGFLKTVTNTLGHVTTFTGYNAFGKAELITPPYGSPTTITYDVMGRIASRTRGSITTTWQYSADGKIHTIHLPDARTITYTYTGSGKPETINDSLNNRIFYTYDIQDNQVKQEIFDPDNVLQHFVEYTYEETGKLDKIIQADATFEDMNYDSVGNLVARINALNQTTEYRFDALNRLTAVIEPGTVTTGYSYDSNNNMTTVTDAEGKQTAFTHDDFGRRISCISPDTGLTTYAYNPADNLISQTDANNITTTYTYDALNRLTAIHYPDSTRDISYGYDENNNLGFLTSMHDSTGSTSYQYDDHGRLTGESRNQDGKLFDVAYGYNDNGELSSITYPSGRIITYNRNTAGQVTSITSTFQGVTTTVANSITYKPFGPREDMVLGNGTTVDNSYNQLYRLTSTTAGTLYNRNYQYFATGHVNTITDNLDPTLSQSFTYDDLGRLETAQGKYGSYGWDYDNVGNRLSETRGTDITGYIYEPGSNRLSQTTTNQTTINYSYDNAGNMLSRDNTTFNWSQNNRLLSAEINTATVGEYGYDSRGLRASRTVNGKTVSSLYDPSGNLLAEIDDNGIILREFVSLDGTKLALYNRFVADTLFTITVTTTSGQPVEGAHILPHTATGIPIEKRVTTNAQGMATFNQSDFTENNYQFHIRYLDMETWSPLVNVRYNSGIQAQLDMELTPVDIYVILGGMARPNAVVSVFSATGEPLGMQGETDSTGKMTFDLPVGRTYTFKVLYLAAFYWSTPLTVAPDGGTFIINDSIPAGNFLTPSILSLLLGQEPVIPPASSSPVQVPFSEVQTLDTFRNDNLKMTTRANSNLTTPSFG